MRTKAGQAVRKELLSCFVWFRVIDNSPAKMMIPSLRLLRYNIYNQ